MGVVVPFPKKYDPFRGGHAPAHLREPFVAAVYAAEARRTGRRRP